VISINNLSKSYGPQTLFEDVNLIVGRRERIGLVGKNGHGKSTLFKMILGDESPSSGSVVIPKNYSMGALDQHIEFTEKTVEEEVAKVIVGDIDKERFRAGKILFGLGLDESDLQKDPNSFSGGYQIRINLAKVLVTNPDMLLLDEPTNYLDIISLRWLKDFLRRFQGEVILITHDQDFMDSVVTHVMGISRKSIKKISGSSAKYYEQMVLEEEVYEKTRVNFEKKKKELQTFIDRFRAKASKAALAQSKMKELAKMGEMEKLTAEKELGFSFHYTECPGKFPIEVENLSFGYNPHEILFKDISFSLGKKDRIGVIGKNGKGKSTLLNILAGELTPLTGTVNQHSKSLLGHFGQTNIERLHKSNSIIQEISEENLRLTHTQVRNICGSMMFPETMAEKKVSVLSGGEKSRVMLGKILARPSNILLLDEPTNHLDMQSIQVLGEEIKKFPGAVVIVTHSEMLLRKLVNRLIIFHRNKAEYFRGTYDEFLEKYGWEEEEAKKSKKGKGAKKDYDKDQKTTTINSGNNDQTLLKLENDILQLEEVLEKYHNLLAEKSASGEDLTECMEMVGKLQTKLDKYYVEFDKMS
jgi:ATP-binding cassette, subfamily F, member 3